MPFSAHSFRRHLLTVAACATVAAVPLVVSGQGMGRSGGPPASQPGPAPQAQDPEGTGAISGVVSDGSTRKPVAGAVVYLGIQGHGPAVRMSRMVTDPKGRFVFQKLPASNTFFMNVSKSGYSDGHYGADTPEATSAIGAGLISLAVGQWFGEANISIWRPGSISGTVVDERGEPVVGAHVRALARIFVAGAAHLAASSTTVTDDRGRYRLSEMQNGDYIVTVPSVQTAVPAATSPLEIEGLTPAAAQNVDSDTPKRNNGAIELDPGHLLIIGNYATAPMRGGKPQAYPIVFYPNVTAAAEAASITIRNAESRDGVDFELQPVPAVRVAGRVDGPPEALRGLVLRLMSPGLEDLGEGSEAATAMVGPDGEFAFLQVPAGSYTIDATRSTLEFSYGPPLAMTNQEMPPTPGLMPGPISMSGLGSGPPGTRYTTHRVAGDAGYRARVPVVVGTTDLTGVDVPLRHAVTMRGRFAFDGAGDPPGFTIVFAEPADGRAALGMPASAARPVDGEEGQFTVSGLLPGEYMLRMVGMGPRYAVKSITSSGVDYSSRPFDTTGGQDINDVVVTYTDRLITLTGAIQGDRVGSAHATVIAFPAEPPGWTRYGLSPSRIKTVPVSSNGAYRLENIPAGSYVLVAVDTSQSRRWQDPAFLEAASKVGTRVSVDWGETKNTDLRMSVIK